MKRDFPQYAALIAAVLVALLVLHFGSAAKGVSLSIVGIIALASFFRPSVGLMAALPLLVTIEPTPTELGWPEYAFALLLAISGCVSLYRRRMYLLPLLLRVWIPLLLLVVFILLNLAVAVANEVTLAEWLRGLAPFVFLLYGVPVWLEAQADKRFFRFWLIALAAMAALFAYQVIKVYVGETLWIPHNYIREQGQWVRVGPDVAAHSGTKVYLLLFRVTLLLQQATSVLLPLGTIWGGWAWLMLRAGVARNLGLALAVLSTIAMTMTYTRSMLLTATVVVSAMVIWSILRRKELLRALTLLLVLGTTVILTITTFSMQSTYATRIHSMTEYADRNHSTAEKDVNITSRLEEYRIAWSMFVDSPVWGKGLGVKHDMQFETTVGDAITERIGYVHNWVMYFLMVGGVLGLATYTTVLLLPALLAWRHLLSSPYGVLVIATIGGMALYALFFAVFRLLPFNMVLGGLWALVVYHLSAKEKD